MYIIRISILTGNGENSINQTYQIKGKTFTTSCEAINKTSYSHKTIKETRIIINNSKYN